MPTPFDDPNLTDAKNTQPLPPPFQRDLDRRAGSLLGGLQSGNLSPQTNTDDVAPQPVMPQMPVITPLPAQTPIAAPSQSAPTPAAAPTGRLPVVPLPTLIGLAVAGGALAVAFVPGLLRRAIPTVPMKTMPPAVVAPSADTSDSPSNAASNSTARDEATNTTESAPSQSDAVAQPTAQVKIDADVSDDTPADLQTSPDDTAPRDPIESESPVPEGEDQSEVRTEEVKVTRGSSSGKRPFRSSTQGYRITPPSQWKLQKSGRRTVWQGPSGAQFLVETGAATSSPRADWQRLEKSLAKKYGRRFRSLGIRDTTLAGRPAAQWDFEITSKSGVVTRKIDVAVHHRGRGYAVMGSAPAGEFEALRPQLESAINSFRLPSTDRPAPGGAERNVPSSSRENDSAGDEIDYLPNQ